MLFEQLITILQKVKTEKDIHPDLHDELFNAAIVCCMKSAKKEQKGINDLEALLVTRMIVLQLFDEIILEMHARG